MRWHGVLLSFIKKYAYWGMAIAYMALIFILSSQPRPFPAIEIRFGDKLVHLVEYAILSLLLYKSMKTSLSATVTTTAKAMRMIHVWVIVITALYGLSDELHQSYVPNRRAELSDLLADMLGAILMQMLIYFRYTYIGAPRRGKGL